MTPHASTYPLEAHERAAAPAPTERPLVDLSAVATEPPGESIAHENEIVDHIAHEPDVTGRAGAPTIAEQLAALVDPAEIRRR